LIFIEVVAFFDGFLKHNPIAPTFATPAYTNMGFQLLSYALESIKGESYASMLENDLFKQLGMDNSTYSKPDSTSSAVIPGDLETTGWNWNMGDVGP
jgi:CubicO group peptidase (beta-lactamase class C family)